MVAISGKRMGQIFSDCTIGNVRHIGLPVCRTFPIVHSENLTCISKFLSFIFYSWIAIGQIIPKCKKCACHMSLLLNNIHFFHFPSHKSLVSSLSVTELPCNAFRSGTFWKAGCQNQRIV